MPAYNETTTRRREQFEPPAPPAPPERGDMPLNRNNASANGHTTVYREQILRLCDSCLDDLEQYLSPSLGRLSRVLSGEEPREPAEQTDLRPTTGTTVEDDLIMMLRFNSEDDLILLPGLVAALNEKFQTVIGEIDTAMDDIRSSIRDSFLAVLDTVDNEGHART